MARKTSLKDIANKVGVSTSLVSYVLNNKDKENRVGKETADKIRKAAKELNYFPNLNARSLKTNISHTIGLIVADISNPFFSSLARTIEDEAYARNYTVIFGSSDENNDKFIKVLDFLSTRQVDGFIVASPEESRETVLGLKESNVPLVLIDRYFSDIVVNTVMVDNFKASFEATNHLLNKGHKRIGAIVYESTLLHYQDRCNGYLEAMKQAGIVDGTQFLAKVNHQSLQTEIQEAVQKLIFEDKVTAIYFSTNTIATEGLKQIKNVGKKIQEEIDVVAFDENLIFQFLDVHVPFVSQPIKKMGQEAVRILIDQIENKDQGIINVLLKATLETKEKLQKVN
ncbi:transcriptional regulator, LacI family [Flavobacterium fluvii]|uniref:Transcriptional regulator, LacI family n=1 Tax=Flavobacterium fluvii TaxID=468056 RepID=A0A1M5IXH8_9FLAO|nr:LacI family DNA-binding transcriptional regulator [Flavobacterium fluvii]SHG33042.1 transcriptional regulator, LacI family [Flavobacterium fluvii]